MTFEWLSSYWLWLDLFSSVYLLEVRNQAGVLVGLAPFVIRKVDGLRHMDLLGRWHSGYQDLIVDRGDSQRVYQAIAQWIHDNESIWDKVLLGPLPPDSETEGMIGPSLQQFTYQVSKVSVGYPRIILADTWEKFLASQPKNRREHIKYKIKLVKRELEPTFVIPSQGDFNRDFKQFFSLHRKRHGTRIQFYQQFPWLERWKIIHFLKTAWGLLHRKGFVHMAFLRSGPQDIAGLVYMDYGNSLSGYQTAFDSEFLIEKQVHKAVAPGFVLAAKMIEYGIKCKKGIFDLMSGDQPYKYQLGAEDSPVSELIVTKAGD
ncbi:MAG: GNAT family N-acetyltransferase [Gammaproteobacteria bacterium]